MAYPTKKKKNQLKLESDRVEDLFPYSLIDGGLGLVGNEHLTELEIKRASLHPDASIKDEIVRKVRATAIGISQYDYEERLRHMGLEY